MRNAAATLLLAAIAALIVAGVSALVWAAPARPTPDPVVEAIRREMLPQHRYLAPLIVARARVESRRRGIDPLALLAIAGVESGYQPHRVRRSDGSVGLYQLLPRGTGPQEARYLLRGCGRPGGLCEAPRLAQRRSRGLRDIVYGTYVAAYEVQRHVLRCYRSRKRYRAPAICPKWLICYAAYNSGYNPPRWYYLKRLCKRYKRLKSLKK